MNGPCSTPTPACTENRPSNTGTHDAPRNSDHSRRPTCFPSRQHPHRTGWPIRLRSGRPRSDRPAQILPLVRGSRRPHRPDPRSHRRPPRTTAGVLRRGRREGQGSRDRRWTGPARRPRSRSPPIAPHRRRPPRRHRRNACPRPGPACRPVHASRWATAHAFAFGFRYRPYALNPTRRPCSGPTPPMSPALPRPVRPPAELHHRRERPAFWILAPTSSSGHTTTTVSSPRSPRPRPRISPTGSSSGSSSSPSPVSPGSSDSRILSTTGRVALARPSTTCVGWATPCTPTFSSTRQPPPARWARPRLTG